MHNLIKSAFGIISGVLLYCGTAIVFHVIGIVDFNNSSQTIELSNFIFIGLIVLTFTLFMFSLYFLYKWNQSLKEDDMHRVINDYVNNNIKKELDFTETYRERV
tara:strand:- start:17 stop:328 length:312 start_codon:yes stop_codon:yes gene_type:complete